MRLPKEELIKKYPKIDFSLLSDDRKLYWVSVYDRKNEIIRLNA